MHRFSRSSFIRFGLLTLCTVLATPIYERVKAGNKSEPMVKASRLKTLSKGYNLERLSLKHKFTDGDYPEEILQQYKALGLTYTRIPVRLSDLNTGSLAGLDALIQRHIKIGLGVSICPSNLPDEIYSNSSVLAKVLAFSKALATHLSSTDPEKVFLEVMNEPVAPTDQIWNNVQLKLISAIRSGAPKHTIIATSNSWSSVQSLPMTQIVKDKNVVYNFHFYDPFVFTHQGATWGWRTSKFMKDIPYPSTSAAVTPLLNSIQDAEAKSAVENYGKENWNRAKVVNVLAPVVNWAKTNGVPIICNEFGATWWVVPRDSWLRYLRDIREVLESYGIGWAEYFGLDMHDNEVMQALGLTPLPPV